MGKRGPKPGTPEARRGGQATRDKYGPEHFREIGTKGREDRRRRGPAFSVETGRRGGEATKARMGPDYYARIGQLGGSAGAGGRKPRRARPDAAPADA